MQSGIFAVSLLRHFAYTTKPHKNEREGRLTNMTNKKIKRNWIVPKGQELTELDKKVLYFQNKGCLVPKRKLIKTPEQIEGIRRSGVVNTGVLDLIASE